MAEKTLFQIYREGNKVSARAQDLTGLKFNHLTIIEFEKRAGAHFIWRCACDCGAVISAKGNNVKVGFKRHCGGIHHFKGHQDAHIKAMLTTKFAQSGPEKCWEWTCNRNTSGYGVMRAWGKIRLAHRLVYQFSHGKIPNGLVVRHKCDNRGCVNPNHLELGTPQDNIDDRVKRQRGDSVLTVIEVLYIKKCLAVAQKKDGTQLRLAAELGVNFSTISDINQGRSWAHVPWPTGIKK